MRKIIIGIETDNEIPFEVLKEDIDRELSCCTYYGHFETVEISEKIEEEKTNEGTACYAVQRWRERKMDDLISRQAAINTMSKALERVFPEHRQIAEKCLNALPSAQPEQRWIPCSERLPDGQGFYLVSVGAPYKTVRVYEYKPCEWYENENLWKKEDGSYCFNWFVEAWMPLPELYQEDNNG